MQISSVMLAEHQMQLSPGAAECLAVGMERVAELGRQGDRRASNGRAVRNALEMAKRQQALRLAAALQEAGAGGKDLDVADLTTLTEEDVGFCTGDEWLGLASAPA
mmetsp:Transcript_6171/g.21126  ORF Transcript_6171/g.21126 Transcript_6171/m.21126 type:complete len:106 (+) Transcript_6171:2812-3129(+)